MARTRMLVLAAAAWACGMTATALSIIFILMGSGLPFDQQVTLAVLVSLGGGLAAGLITGFAFQQTVSGFTFRHSLLLSVVWGIVLGSFPYITSRFMSDYFIILPMLFGPPLFGIIGGLLTACILTPQPTIGRALRIAGGWALSFLVFQIAFAGLGQLASGWFNFNRSPLGAGGISLLVGALAGMIACAITLQFTHERRLETR